MLLTYQYRLQPTPDQAATVTSEVKETTQEMEPQTIIIEPLADTQPVKTLKKK